MRILVLPGDGIGPEITKATMAVLDRLNAELGLGLSFEQDIVGFETEPKNEQERKRLRSAKRELQDGANLFRFNINSRLLYLK